MSYDLEIGVRVAGTKDLTVRIAEPERANPTYNLGQMFRACMDWDYEQSKWYKCIDVVPKIERGLHELRFNSKAYKQYNPPNGWGSIGSAVEDLESLLKCIHETSEDYEIPLEHLYMRW